MQKTVVWITGAKGRLGQELTAELSKDPTIRLVKSDTDVDITDPAEVRFFMDVNVPDIVVNCASITGARAGSEDEVQIYKVNSLGARNLAASTRKHSAALIQLSTNEIFANAQGEKFNEFDQPSPKSVFGKSKLAAENLVRELNPKHMILRSGWVYDFKKRDHNPHLEIVEKARKGETIEARADYFSSPTSTTALARAIHSIIHTPLYGIYHAADEGSCSMYEFTRKIVENAGLDPALVVPVTKEKQSMVLENLMFKMTDMCQMPKWEEDLAEQMAKIKDLPKTGDAA